MAIATIGDRLASIREQIDTACRDAGRGVDSVTLIGASKRQTTSVVQAAVAAGLSTLGENQVQEASRKIGDLPVDLDWHLIGHLQSNKIKAATRLFSTIHSLDRPKIVRGIDREAAKTGRRLEGFLQVNLGAEPTKHGFAVEGFAETVAPFANLDHLRIIGLMAIPPFDPNPAVARSWFAALRRMRDALASRTEWQAQAGGWPGALSMGMSSDFPLAILEGATHIRVGTALFGTRS